MTLKWCVLTGALMIAFVCATFMHKKVVQDPAGVYTRWYDGTTARVDKFYHNGKLQSSTVYGDDGKTVIILVELTDAGAIVHTKVRREDGKVMEKKFSNDGKVMLEQNLWVGDETYFTAHREFYDDGTLKLEVLKTEDGSAAFSQKMFNPDGSLSLYTHVLSNADQESLEYLNGKLTHRGTFKANGDSISEFFFDGTEKISRRYTRIALTGEQTMEYFQPDGTLFFSSTRAADDSKIVNALYSHGQMIIRQTGVKLLLSSVEEFTPGSSHPKRKLELDAAGNVIAVDIYRPDGSLARVKHMNNGEVESQDDYDATGTRVIQHQAGGEPEPVSPKLTMPISPNSAEEEVR